MLFEHVRWFPEEFARFGIDHHSVRRFFQGELGVAFFRIDTLGPGCEFHFFALLDRLGAFDCAASLAGQHIALIDDVMTTGATLSEAARILKKAGAAKVEAWVLARAVMA